MKSEFQKHIEKVNQIFLYEKLVLITPKNNGGTSMAVIRHFNDRTKARREAERLNPGTRIHDAMAENFLS